MSHGKGSKDSDALNFLGSLIHLNGWKMEMWILVYYLIHHNLHIMVIDIANPCLPSVTEFWFFVVIFLAAFTQSCQLFIMAFGGRLFSFSSVYSKSILTRDFHLQYIDCFDISPRLKKTFHIDLSKNYVPSQYNMSQTFNQSFVFICLKRCVLHDVNMFFNCFFSNEVFVKNSIHTQFHFIRRMLVSDWPSKSVVFIAKRFFTSLKFLNY